MNYSGMVCRACAGEQVEGNPKLMPAIEKLAMVCGRYLLRSFPFLFSAQGNGSSMLIASGDHQYVVALETMITGEDVCGQISASNMSQMERAIGIRPGGGNKNIFGQ